MKKKPEFSDLVTLSDNFSNEQICREYMEKILWDGKPVCPYCGHERVYKFKDKKRYKCASNKCYRVFNVVVGTYLENTKIPLRKWLHALYIFSSHKKGISSYQLAKDISITQKSAWFMLSRLREVLNDKNPSVMTNTTQIDETWVGGKVGNFHLKKRMEVIMKQKDNKNMVIGMVEQDGRCLLKPMAVFEKKAVTELVRSNLQDGSTLVSDSFMPYRSFSKYYNHQYVRHAHGEYKRNGYHTNSVEGLFAYLKRGIIGIYHHTSAKHLHRYCNEFSFRYNTRKCGEVERFDIALKQSFGRLKYKELIKNS